jgi:ferredoxin
LVAKTIANNLENTEIVSMAKAKSYVFTKQYITIGFVFPIYWLGLPKMVMEFISNLTFDNNKESYYYTVATYGGRVGNGNIQVQELLKKKNIILNYGGKLRMVGNNIVLYNVLKWADKISKNARERLPLLINDIKNRKNNKTPIKFNTFLLKNVYEKNMRIIALTAKNFNIDDNCIGCGICKELCPAKNIELIDKKPVFGNKCEYCLACIHYCPRRAINYKNKTQKRRRFTNPEISYKELSNMNNI